MSAQNDVKNETNDASIKFLYCEMALLRVRNY